MTKDILEGIEERRRRGGPKWDIDRGMSIRANAETGQRVGMYKSEPGIYYDVNGEIVSDEIAKAAGFPTEEFARERLRRQKLEAASAAIAAELEQPRSPAKRILISEVAGFRLIDLGLGRHVVEGPDGLITPRPITAVQGKLLLAKLAEEPAPRGAESNAP